MTHTCTRHPCVNGLTGGCSNRDECGWWRPVTDRDSLTSAITVDKITAPPVDLIDDAALSDALKPLAPPPEPAGPILTAAQCRAGRALIHMHAGVLSRISKVDPSTISQFECGIITPHARTLKRLRDALEAHGVTFTPRGVTL